MPDSKQNEQDEDRELATLLAEGPSRERVERNAVSAVRRLQKEGCISPAHARRWIQNIRRDIMRNGV